MAEGRLSLFLLGPFQLRIDAVPRAVPRVKTRETLTVLALYANEPVSAEHLVDLLWDEKPPASAHANLRNYLTEVHRLLPPRPDGLARLVRGPGTALLRIDPAELDLLRFRAELTVARGYRDQGQDVRAAAAYGRALRCWRGPALPGLRRSGRLGDKLELLEAARLDAYDDYGELCLVLGEEAGEIAELRETLARHPFRERTCANLMTALYRAGQPAEALELYRRTERALREELGVTPTPRLRRLQLAILHHDPGLAGGQPRPSVRAPWQALPVPSPFVGRPDEFAAAVATLRSPADVGTVRAVVLHGLAGAGKSALASAIAHRCRADFPDGCLYANLNGADGRLAPAPPRDVIARFLRILHGPTPGPAPVPADLDEASAVLRSGLAGKRILLLLDNAASADQVRPLLPGDGCAVIVTSRGSMSTLDAAHVVVGKLPHQDATTLMTRLLGAGRTAAEPDALERLVAACGRLPLALRIAAGRLLSRPDWPLGRLADRLESEYRRLDELHVDDLDVRSSFSVSYDALLEEPGPTAATAAELFGLLGLLDAADVVDAAAAALLDRDETEAEQALERLCRDSLIEPAGPGRYRFHDLLRLFAREQGVQRVPAGEWEEALRRLLRWYGSTAEAAVRLLQPGLAGTTNAAPDPAGRPAPFRGQDEARRWIESERHSIVMVLRQSAGGAPATRRAALELALEIGPYLNTWGYWTDLRETAELALRLGEELGDKAATAKACGSLGTAYLRTGDTPGSQDAFLRALALFREIGDAHGASRMLNNLALYHRRIGDYTTSIGYLREVLDIRRGLGDARGQATALDNLGLVYQSLGRYPDAGAAHRESRDIARQLGDSLLEALILLNLGETVRLAGRLDEAAGLLREAGRLARTAGNRAAAAEALDGIEKVLIAQGRDREAEECRRQAAEIRHALAGGSAAAGP